MGGWMRKRRSTKAWLGLGEGSGVGVGVGSGLGSGLEAVDEGLVSARGGAVGWHVEGECDEVSGGPG